MLFETSIQATKKWYDNRLEKLTKERSYRVGNHCHGDFGADIIIPVSVKVLVVTDKNNEASHFFLRVTNGEICDWGEQKKTTNIQELYHNNSRELGLDFVHHGWQFLKDNDVFEKGDTNTVKYSYQGTGNNCKVHIVFEDPEPILTKVLFNIRVLGLE